MKNFIKILLAFLLLFFVGLFVTYKTINHTFKKIEKEHIVSTFSNSVIYQTSLIA
jgi:uncharacterized protein YneF (UPF0154 family)